MSTATPTPAPTSGPTTHATAPARPVGSVLAPAGALGTSLALLIGIAADPGALTFVAAPLVVGLVVAGLARRFGTWSKALAAVWGVAALAQLPATPILEALPRPDSLFDFVPGWLFVLSAITALVGGVLGVVRRGQPGPLPLERSWLAGAGAVVALIVAVSGLGSITTDSTLTAEERAGAIEVSMVDGSFEPGNLLLVPGEVRFALRNDGNVLHTFTVPELDIDEALSPGQEVLVTATVEADIDGVVFYCRPHSEAVDGGRDGMAGVLSVG